MRVLITILSLLFPFLLVHPSDAAMPWQTADGQMVPTLAPVLKDIMPGVVNISVKSKVKVELPPMLQDPMFRQFFGDQFNLPDQGEREVQGAGSGVIVDAGKGFVITNNHVINKADEIFVILKDKRQLKAEVVGTDEETDIAILKVKPSNLTAIKIGTSKNLQVGDFVLAIGNPFGLGHTVTSGIISALGRSGLGIESYEDFIQTDASINPGNSGGALVNLNGELIGINTAILSRTGGNVGIGFAIPIDMVRDTMEQIVTHGKIERGQLGVQIQDITPELAEALGINADQGAAIARVQPGSPAENAGLKEGDVVTSFNGVPVAGAAELKNRVGQIRVGSKVAIEVLRGGEKKTYDVIVGKRPANKETAAADQPGVAAVHPLLKGATLARVPDEIKKEMKITGGVYVIDIEQGSVAERAGLAVEDIIVSCNRVPVNSPDDLARAAGQNKRAILLNVRRGDAALFLVIR